MESVNFLMMSRETAFVVYGLPQVSFRGKLATIAVNVSFDDGPKKFLLVSSLVMMVVARSSSSTLRFPTLLDMLSRWGCMNRMWRSIVLHKNGVRHQRKRISSNQGTRHWVRRLQHAADVTFTPSDTRTGPTSLSPIIPALIMIPPPFC